MTARYYVPDLPASGDCLIDGPEAHHLLHVMRCQVGDVVELFDGRGRFASATVLEAGRKQVRLGIENVTEAAAKSRAVLHLGVALPKGDRQKWLIEKCAELGVARLTPIATTRSVAQPTDKALDRLRRGVIEACKQCGRNQLMEVQSPVSFADWIRDPDTMPEVEATRPTATRWIAHPGDPSFNLHSATAQRLETSKSGADRTQLFAAIGPEGGFSEEEVAMATEAGWQSVCLGDRILRIETAALAIAAANLMVEQALSSAD